MNVDGRHPRPRTFLLRSATTPEQLVELPLERRYLSPWVPSNNCHVSDLLRDRMRATYPADVVVNLAAATLFDFGQDRKAVGSSRWARHVCDDRSDVNVFISYQRADTLFAAHTVGYALRLKGFDAFVDTGSVAGGALYPEAIATAVSQSNVALALMGRSSTAAGCPSRRASSPSNGADAAFTV